MKKQHEAELRAKQEELDRIAAERQKQILENEEFWIKLADSEDLNDNLTGLCNYIQRNLGATGVYIGKLQKNMKPINDDDNDQAHIDEEAPLVI